MRFEARTFGDLCGRHEQSTVTPAPPLFARPAPTGRGRSDYPPRCSQKLAARFSPCQFSPKSNPLTHYQSLMSKHSLFSFSSLASVLQSKGSWLRITNPPLPRLYATYDPLHSTPAVNPNAAPILVLRLFRQPFWLTGCDRVPSADCVLLKEIHPVSFVQTRLPYEAHVFLTDRFYSFPRQGSHRLESARTVVL